MFLAGLHADPFRKTRAMHAYRSHTCADLTAAHVGQTVRLAGWVHRVRDHGGVLFVDLRDHYGITQVIALDGTEFRLNKPLTCRSDDYLGSLVVSEPSLSRRTRHVSVPKEP